MATCQQCNAPAQIKFCSTKCKDAWHSKQRYTKAVKVPYTCDGCGKQDYGRPDQKACSSNCRSVIRRRLLKSQA